MIMAEQKIPVSVFTEWAPLEEVILGSAIGFNHKNPDILFRFLYENWDGDFRDKKGQYELATQFIEERQEDLDGIQKILEGLGVVVRRPNAFEPVQQIKTPTFESVTHGPDSPRDMFFLYGNEIIETPPTNPRRYFEGMLLRDIFMDYFRRGAGWTVAPRPLLTEESTDFEFWESHFDEPLHTMEQIDPRYDIACDAANCLKFGKDIIINVGTKNHELYAMWLQRHLGDKARVHPIRITDSHIDWQMLPLAPGKLLVHEHYVDGWKNRLPEALQKWDMIYLKDESKAFRYPPNHLQMASSQGMDMNLLSVDERTIIIRDEAVNTIRELERKGFEPIPVRLRHCELFGDGPHCCTVDVRRKDSPDDYFGG
jgi:glycine amidinotransferase